MEERKGRIVAFMKEAAYKPLLFEELVMVLDVPKSDRELFRDVLGQLEAEGRIFKTKKDRYGVPERMNLAAGRIQGNERGFGFFIPDDYNMKEVFIPADSMNGAMHNDRVIIRINRGVTEGRSAEGEVIRVLSRANKTVVGTFESSRYFGFVVPDDTRVSGDIFVPKDESNNALTGQKVVVQITKWPESRRNAEGKVIEILGDKDDPGTDIVSIIKAYNLNEDFPKDVLAQAESIPQSVTEDMLKERRDLRGLTMVTIDGEDAKDLDDAVSIEKLPDGNYRLGVHIADVSFYVTEESPLDKEALKRGTSVYLVDRVIPMLPKMLSNGICSLNPAVDRLAFTVMMDINNAGKVVNHEIFESVVRINERMTYTDVYKILVEDNEELKEKYAYLLDDFKTMEELAIILRNKRMSRGAIDFDFEETKIILDEKGRPVEVKPYEITIANKIIEEFMLVCNETVAEHFYWANSPFVYRIHEDPDIEKIEALNEFVYNLGYHIKGVNKIHPGALQDLLKKAKGKKEERIISTVMLRSLQKARYSHQNVGHFGLAARFYCHFTSPIRRYPDLIIHRIIKEYLKGKIAGKREEILNERLPEVARLCSEKERVAEEAERDTEDLKKVEYMKQHIGEEFEGIISGVTSFGMFVELDNTIEGLVRMSSLEDDYYIYNEKQYCLIGERNRKVYRIGDAVKVQVIKADMASRQIDFIIVDNMENNKENGEKPETYAESQSERKAKRKRKEKGDKRVKMHIAGKKGRKKRKIVVLEKHMQQ
jgi:ribonuclease R